MSQRLLILLLLLPTSTLLAQTGPALLLKPLLSEDETLELNGAALLHGQGSTSNDQPFQMSTFELLGRFREQRERFIPRVGWDLLYLDLDTTDPGLPNSLTDVSIAAGLELGRYYNWQSGLTIGIGYAGDTPFGEGDAWYGKATLMLGRKLDKRTDVALVLDYDGNRSIFPDVPLPGIAYRHEFDPRLSYTIGLPVSAVRWKPFDPVTVEVIWTLMDSFDAMIEYELAPAWTLRANLESRQEAFNVEAYGGNNRLLFQQRRAELGVRWQPQEHTRLLAAIGYAFGGEFSAGWDQRNSDLVADISDEPYVRFGFERRF